jgi:hypothetical protein
VIAQNPHHRPARKPRANWRGFIGVDPQGKVRHHAANAEQAAQAVNRSRVSIWSSVSHGWLCGGLRWYVVDALPDGLSTPAAPDRRPPAPATSVEDGIARAHEWRRRHQRRAWFPFEGRIYIQCADCRDWKVEDDFPRTSASKRCHILRESYCWDCIRRIKRDFKAGRASSRRNLSPKRTAPVAPLPKVVNPTVVTRTVYQGRNLDFSPRRPETVVERTPAEWERGRFERASKINPLLTWAHWVEITRREPMKPRKRRRLQAVPDAPTGVAL